MATTKVTMPEPVVVVMPNFNLCFLGSGPIAPIIKRNNITVGSLLITTERSEAYAAAKVREALGWISIDDRLPDQNLLVLVYSPPQPGDWPGTVRIELDYICPDYEDWHNHSEHYEHFLCVALPEDSTGPSEKAPYTHWLDFPNPPQHDNE